MGANYSTGRSAVGAFGGGGFGGGGSGGVRRDAEVEAAGRSVASGGDVNEAIGRIRNSGGGDFKVGGNGLASVLGSTPNGTAQSADGHIIVDTSRLGDPNGKVIVLDKAGNEVKAGTATVTVSPNGVSSVKVGGQNFVVGRTRLDITENQRDKLVSANLPPSLRGARFDKAGNMNGWSLDLKAFPDKEIRAFLYQKLGKDGVLRFPSDSPVAGRLRSELSQAGYGRINVAKLNEIFRAEPTARYKAGDKAAAIGGTAGFGAAKKLENEKNG